MTYQLSVINYEMFGNLRGPSETSRDLREPLETFGNLRKPSETVGNLQKPSETFRNLQIPSKPFGNLRKPSETFGSVRFGVKVPVRFGSCALKFVFGSARLGFIPVRLAAGS